jgi:hypothetical protein
MQNDMTTAEALNALIAADPNRSYCIQRNDWAHVPSMSGMPHTFSTEPVCVFVTPGIRASAGELIKGPSIGEAVTDTIQALKLAQQPA